MFTVPPASGQELRRKEAGARSMAPRTAIGGHSTRAGIEGFAGMSDALSIKTAGHRVCKLKSLRCSLAERKRTCLVEGRRNGMCPPRRHASRRLTWPSMLACPRVLSFNARVGATGIGLDVMDVHTPPAPAATLPCTVQCSAQDSTVGTWHVVVAIVPGSAADEDGHFMLGDVVCNQLASHMLCGT